MTSTIMVNGQCSLPPEPLLLRLSNCSIPADLNEYPDGLNSWGILVSIASPPQELCLVPSTVLNNTAIVGAEICSTTTSITADQCYSSHGGYFNESITTSGFNTASPQDVLAPDDVWNKFNPAFTEAGNATIELSSITLPAFPVAIISSGSNFSESQLGLANNSVFLHSLVSAGLSPVAGFGMLAGSQSVSAPRAGHIVFGGYDAASLAGPFTNYSISSTTGAGNRACPLQVVVEELTLLIPGLPPNRLVSEGTPMPSCIEPYDNEFRLPPNVLASFQQATGGLNGSSLLSPQLYVIEPPLLYNTSGFNGSLIFKLKGGLEVEIPNEELTQPLRGLDKTGKMVLQDNLRQVNIFSKGDPLNTASLGKVFLSQLYLAVNYDAQQFHLAPAVTDSVAAPDLVSFNPSTSIYCSPATSNHWWIGVVVLACTLAAILVLICVYLFCRRRSSRRRRRSASHHWTDSEAVDTGNHMEVAAPLPNGMTPETSQQSNPGLHTVHSRNVRPSITSVGTASDAAWEPRRESLLGPLSPHTEGPSSPPGELPVSPRTDGRLSPTQELPASSQAKSPHDLITELPDE